MKDKAPIIVLVIVIIGLMVALLRLNNKAADDRLQAENNIKTLSNNWTSVRNSLEEQQAVNRALETNLATTTAEYSNKLVARDAQLAGLESDLAKNQAEAKSQAEAAAAEVAARDKKISDLEGQNVELDKQSADLRNSITNLEGQISVTQKKLAASEGDKAALMRELKDLQAKKDDLERKFNDLAALKEQVHKLKEELSVARRLDWIRRGVYEALGDKGGARLAHVMQSPPAQSPSAPTNSTLNVDLNQDGGVKIQAPTPAKTN